jgi:hypothetical protein
MGTCAACYNGTRFSFHYSNGKYLGKTLSLCPYWISSTNCFWCCFQSLISFPLAHFKSYNITATHVANGSFAEHYWSRKLAVIHSYTNSWQLFTPKKKFTYTLTIKVTQPQIINILNQLPSLQPPQITYNATTHVT